jgi:microcystin-dependent protein
MATVTASYNWVSGETVTPTKLNSAAAPTVVVADNEVTTSKILDGAITTTKVADGAITQAKLNSSVVLVPAGAVMPFAMNSAPAGWLAADGSNVNRTTYAALFSAIGTTYGVGDGSTTFALPDLRGIFVRGSGLQTIGGITYNKTFADKEGDAFQGHYHTIRQAANVAGAGTVSRFASGDFNDNGLVTTPVSDGANGTPRTASETRPANIALLYCIKF